MVLDTTITLNTGAKMPVLGLGTWLSKPGEVKTAVEVAIDAGYRHIDCAYIYGNEDDIGEAIQCKIKEGKIKREDLFMFCLTKLWMTQFRRVRECFFTSLRRLNLEYVDLYLLHRPYALQHTSAENLMAIDSNGVAMLDEDIHYVEVEKLYKEGLVKAIGVSDFNEYQINKILKEAEIKPSVHQFEMHPYLVQEELLRYCKSNDIVVTGYGSFSSPQRPWARPGEPAILDNPVFQSIAQKHGKTVAQIVLRFMIAKGVSVIPKSVNPSRIISNSEIFNFDLTDEDKIAIKNMNCDYRGFTLPQYSKHKYYPFRPNYSE